MQGLMNRCLSQETMVDHLREKAESSKVELRELTAWKVVKENKLDLTKKLLDKLEV